MYQQRDEVNSNFGVRQHDMNIDNHSGLETLGKLTTTNEFKISISEESEISYRVKLEQLISYLSDKFTDISLNQLDENINKILQVIGEFERVDRSYIFLLTDQKRSLISNTHEWCAPGIEPQKEILQNYKVKDCSSWFIGKLDNLEIVHINKAKEIPSSIDREFLQEYGISSLLAVPIIQNKKWIGFVGFDSVKQEKTWTEENIMLLQVFAQILSDLWEREKTETQLRKSRRFLNSLINSLPGIIFSGEIRQEERIMTYISEGCLELTGYKSSELTRSKKFTYHNIINQQDLPTVITKLQTSLKDKHIYEIEYRILTKKGQEKWILEKGQIIENSEHKKLSIEGFIADISKLKTGEKMLAKQAEILEMIAKGNQIEEILNKLLKSIEEVSPNLKCSLMLVTPDKKHLRCYITSNIHPDYGKELQKVAIGENEGLCGAAASKKERVIITDILRHPNCAQYRELIIKYELRSGFSIPILSSQGKLFGVFSMYYNEAKEPLSEDLQLIETISHLAGIALEGYDAQESLKQAENKYRNIFENITQGIFQCTAEGDYISANSALARIYGYETVEELKQKTSKMGTQIYVDPNELAELKHRLQQDGHVHDFESQIYKLDGSIIWISENTRSVYDPLGDFLYHEGTVENITKRHKAEEELIYQVYHDSLTGLPNRTWVIKKLKKIIELAEIYPNYQYALLFLDLDGFKLINDSLGHVMGDKLLQQVAQRLDTLTDKQQTLARLSGDEFVILVENFQKIDQVIKLVNDLQKQFIQPFKLNLERIFTNCSIGVALSQVGYQLPEQILRDADIAMYQAKSKGKGTYAFFSPVMQDAVLNRLQIENDLHGALERGEFFLCYQPIVMLTTGRLMGFEALIRWHHPTKGLVSPGRFVPIAEETGLIRPLGLWVLRQACGQLKIWQNRYPDSKNLSVSVNLSIHQFKQPDLLQQINAILQEEGIEGRHLKLEITESAFVETAGSEIAILQELRDLGIRLCIDDFGTGYSSLSRLHELPIDTLKIDQAFVRRLETSSDVIIKTIITLAHVLNMSVVAEGIETTTQLKKLHSMHCEMGQGYLFSRPVDAQTATNIVAINFQTNSFLPSPS